MLEDGVVERLHMISLMMSQSDCSHHLTWLHFLSEMPMSNACSAFSGKPHREETSHNLLKGAVLNLHSSSLNLLFSFLCWQTVVLLLHDIPFKCRASLQLWSSNHPFLSGPTFFKKLAPESREGQRQLHEVLWESMNGSGDGGCLDLQDSINV